ncbi:MAG: bacteriohemerythrin [Clostridia bacterium]|nr:bacteriohemerythrin [Clostridia bacterium]
MFKWKNEFSINIEAIDEQHKRLFEIGSKIYEVSILNDSYDHYDEIISILEELSDYTKYHFEYEENLLRKYNYKGLEEQEIEHTFFIKKLDKIGKKDIDGQQAETASAIYTFVLDWISAHILKSDMKYKEFLKSQGVY